MRTFVDAQIDGARIAGGKLVHGAEKNSEFLFGFAPGAQFHRKAVLEQKCGICHRADVQIGHLLRQATDIDFRENFLQIGHFSGLVIAQNDFIAPCGR